MNEPQIIKGQKLILKKYGNIDSPLHIYLEEAFLEIKGIQNFKLFYVKTSFFSVRKLSLAVLFSPLNASKESMSDDIGTVLTGYFRTHPGKLDLILLSSLNEQEEDFFNTIP